MKNTLYNPLLLIKVLKNYLNDPYKLHQLPQDQLIKLQTKSFKKILKYAYQTPLYHDIYKKAGIHPQNITRLTDIKKLPFITKEDIRKYHPHGIVPPTFNTQTAILASTGGSTSQSLPIYLDLYTVIKAMLAFVRALNEYQVDWRKTKMSLLIDLSEQSFENQYFLTSIFHTIRYILPQKNIQTFDLFTDPQQVINELDAFQPEFIAGYPYALIQLGIYKHKGYGDHINPRCMMSSGSYFDQHSRKIVEHTFNTRIYDFYAATESGPIAFECAKGSYHVHADLIYPEYLNNQGNDVQPGTPGTLVITKLYGAGTPLIRYTGIDDVVTCSLKKCSCGMSGDIIACIHGRRTDSILLPDGHIVLFSFIENIIGETIYELKADKIRRIQIIQHQLDTVELKLLIDSDLRHVGTPVTDIFSLLQKKLVDGLGSNMNIIITEVESFQPKDPYFISKIKPDLQTMDSFLV